MSELICIKSNKVRVTLHLIRFKLVTYQFSFYVILPAAILSISLQVKQDVTDTKPASGPKSDKVNFEYSNCEIPFLIPTAYSMRFHSPMIIIFIKSD